MNPPKSFGRFASFFNPSAFVIAIAAMMSSPAAFADTAESTWIGTSSTNWSTTSAWTSGTVPSATVSAVFNTATAYADQPTLTGASIANGIWDTGVSGIATTTIGGAFGLTISGTATLDSIARAGILLDGAGNNNLTISSAVTGVTLSNTTNILVNNGGTLTIAAPLILTAGTNTFGSTSSSGSGSIVISGLISGLGDFLTVNDTAGTTSVTLSGSNSYTGTTTVSGGTLNLSGTVVGSVLVINTNPNAFFNETSTGAITGATKTFTLTSGSATLGGANNYGAATTVAGGALSLTGTLNGSSVTSSTGSFTEGSTGVVAGSGITFTVNTGTATLGGANTYTGLTTVTAGLLKLGSGGSINSGNALTTAAVGTFDIAGNGQTLGLLTNSGTVTSSSGTGALTIGNGSTGAGAFTGSMNVVWNQAASSTAITGSFGNTGNLTLNATGAGTIGVTTVDNTGLLTNSGGGAGTTTISGVIGTNVTGVTEKSASSTLALNGSNTFTGALSILNGTVSSSQVGPTGFGAGSILLGDTTGGSTNNATLLYTGSNLAIANPITVNGASSGALTIEGQTNSNAFTGNVTLNNNLNLANLTAAKTTTFSGNISGASNGIIVPATNAGIVALNGSNSFNGLTVDAGTLSSSQNSPAGFGSGAINLGLPAGGGGGATLLYTGTNLAVANPITVNGGDGTLTIEGQTSSNAFTGGITLNGNLTLANLTAGQTTTLSGVINGGSNLATPATNLGIVAITGANSSTFFGNVTLGGGILDFANGSLGGSFGPASFSITMASGTLQYALGNTQDISSDLAASGTNAVNIDVNDNTVSFATAIGNTFTGGLKLTSSTVGGILVLNGAQGYTGTTSVGNGATLQLASGGASINTGSVLTTLAGGTFDLDGNSQTLGLLTDGGTVTSSSGTGALTIGNGSTGAGAFTGSMNVIWNQGATSSAITGSAGFTGNLTLNATGAGTIGFTAVNNIGTVTNSGGGAGTTTISGIIGTNVTGVTENSTTSELVLSNTANTFTGGVTVTSGTVYNGAAGVTSGTASNFGTGTITLGSAGGSAGTLSLSPVNNAVTLQFANAITLAGGSAVGTLYNNATNGGTVDITGPINVNGSSLTITDVSLGALNINNTISGGGNVIIAANSTGLLSINGVVNNSGTLTNSGTGSTIVKISSIFGSSLGNVIENSPTSTLETGGSNNSGWGGNIVIASGNFALAFARGVDETGTRTITIGTPSSNANATLSNPANNFINTIVNSQITLAPGDTGLLIINDGYSGATNGLNVNVPIALNGDNLTFIGGAGLVQNGTISGTGNLIYASMKNTTNTLFDSGLVNNLGTIKTEGPITFSGTIAAVGNNNISLIPSYGIATVNNALQGASGGLTVAGNAFSASSSGQAYGNSIGSVLLDGTNATYTGQNQFLSGNVQLNGLAATVTLDSWLGQGSAPVLVGNNSGVLQTALYLSLGTLNRSITIEAGNAGNTILGASNTSTFGGPISLGKSLYLAGNLTVTSTITGAISSNAATPGADSIVKAISTVTTNLNNASNSYNGGTVVAGGLLISNTAGALGTGNVAVEAGDLRLTATNDTPGSIYVGPLGIVSSSVISGTGRGGFFSFGTASVLDKNSSGAVGIAATDGTALNLANLGNGDMYLAVDNGNQTYSATSLGANIDGNYRLGWNSSASNNDVLTISQNGVLTGAAELIIGGVEGKVDPLIALGDNTNTQGSVLLSGSNSYSGGTVVNPFSTLTGAAQTGATGASPFGSSTGSMTLHDSTLVLNNNGSNATLTTVGALAYDGASQLTVLGVTSGTNVLSLGAFTRNNQGTLTIASSGGGGLGVNSFVTSTGSTAIIAAGTTVTGSGGGTFTMLAPYLFDAAGNYLTYGATGFTSITTATNAIPAASTNDIVKTTGTDSLASSGTIAALSLTGAANVNNSSGTAPVTLGLSSGGLNDVGATQAVTIGASGTNKGVNLDFSGYAGDAVINTGAQTLTIANLVNAPNGLTKTGAGTLYLQGFNTSGTNVLAANTIGGTITVNQGWLSTDGTTMGTYSFAELGSSVSSSIGQIDTLTIYSDSGLGTANLELNGGGITNFDIADANDTAGTFILSASRNVIIGPNGGSFSPFAANSNQNGTDTSNFIVNSLISGTGVYLDFGADSTTSNITSTPELMVLTNTGNSFLGPINVYGRTNLVISNSAELGNSANLLTLDGGNAILQYGSVTAAPWVVTPTVSGTIANPITFLNMGGGVDVTSTSAVPVTLTLTGPISGDGSFYKNGNGTLVLTATSGNTFSGSVIVNSGDLVIDDGSQLGLTTAVVAGTNLGAADVSGNAAYIEPGAEIDLLATNGNIALGGSGGKTLYLSGTGVGNGGAIVNLSGSNSDAGQVVLQANTTIATAAGSQLLLGGAVSDGTNGIGSLGYSLTGAGSGTLILAGSNTYTGATNIASTATLQLGNGGTTGSLSPSSTLNDTGALIFDRSNTVTQGVDFSGSPLSGLTSLTQSGTGTLVLNAANTYTGVTNINSGTVSINTVGTGVTPQPLGESSTVNLGVASTSSGILNYTGGIGALDKNINALGNGLDTVQNTGSGLLTLSGTLTKNGTILTLNGGSSGLTISGPIVGSNANSDLVIVTGTTTLTAANSYNGPTYVNNGGTLVNGNAAGALPSATTLTLGGTNGNTSGTFDLGGNNQTVAGLNTAGTGVANIVTNNGGANAALTVGNGGTFAGHITDGSTNTTALNVTGGTLSLTGSNGYSGPTTVTGGTLLVSGSISGSSSVSVTNATLEGTGSITGPVNIGNGGAPASAIITVGASGTTGTLSTGALTLNSDAAYNFNLNSTLGTSDLLNVTGALTLGTGVAALNGNDLAFQLLSGGQVFDIANFTTGITGYFANLPEGAVYGIGSNPFIISYGIATPGEITLTAVPEPGTWGLLIGGLGILMLRRRSRRLM